MIHHSHVATVVLLLAVTLSGCESPTAAEEELIVADALQARLSGELVFLAMRITPAAHMDALFEGAVVSDEAGCLRLDSSDAATVVWPRYWSLERRDDTVRILDADGHFVASLGERLSLPGGEVETLPAAMGFTEADRELAGNRCPGRYWIVGNAG